MRTNLTFDLTLQGNTSNKVPIRKYKFLLITKSEISSLQPIAPFSIESEFEQYFTVDLYGSSVDKFVSQNMDNYVFYQLIARKVADEYIVRNLLKSGLIFRPMQPYPKPHTIELYSIRPSGRVPYKTIPKLQYIEEGHELLFRKRHIYTIVEDDDLDNAGWANIRIHEILSAKDEVLRIPQKVIPFILDFHTSDLQSYEDLIPITFGKHLILHWLIMNASTKLEEMKVMKTCTGFVSI